MTDSESFPTGNGVFPANRWFDGGGGNRTREAFPTGSPLRFRVAEPKTCQFIASCDQHSLVDETLELELKLYNRRTELSDGAHTYLYVVEETSAVKLGIAARNLANRLSNLQVGNPRPLTLIAYLPATLALERFLHGWLSSERVAGEWFNKSRRVYEVCAMLVSVAEQCDDLVAAGEFPTIHDTLAILTCRIEDIVLLQKAA